MFRPTLAALLTLTTAAAALPALAEGPPTTAPATTMPTTAPAGVHQPAVRHVGQVQAGVDGSRSTPTPTPGRWARSTCRLTQTLASVTPEAVRVVADEAR